MPTLRQMIDDKTYYAAGIAPMMPEPASPPPGNAGMGKNKLPQPGNSKFGKSMKQSNGKPGQAGKNGKNGSPVANHIANHFQDPLGATQEGQSNLSQKKLEYDQAREDMQRNLAPVQSVLNHISSIHGIMPGTPAGQIPTPGITPGAQPGAVDPQTGLPMDPAMAGQDPNNPGGNDNPDMQNGVPGNMNQTPGKMNQNRPSIAGHQPGVSPGPQQSVVPGKMGMPQPGGQTNKIAAKPKGAGTIPGAKGPGDPKVSNKTKQAQGNSSRQVKISVAAATSCSSIPVMKASGAIESTFGLVSLSTMSAAGTSSGAKKNWSVRNKGHVSKKEKNAHFGTMEAVLMPKGAGEQSWGRGDFGKTSNMPLSASKRKKMKAGPAGLSDKVSDSGAEVAYNPTGGMKACSKCGKKHSKSMECSDFA